MTLTTIGWLVVHSLWQGIVIAGVVAMALGCLHRARASTRYAIGCLGLALMVLGPVAATWSGTDAGRVRTFGLSPETVRQVISYPTFIWWGSIVVPIMGGCWAVGLAVSMLRVAGEARRAHVLRHRDAGPVAGDAQAAFASLRQTLAPAAHVDIRTSPRAPVPMVIGWRRPRVLLPTGVTTYLRPGQVRAIVAHELAHVSRGDYAANLLQVAADAVLFHHPAARWLSRRIRTEREYCCDDVAVRVNEDALEYARALAILEDARAETRLAVAAVSGTLLDRVERILGRPRRGLTPVRGMLVALGALTLAAPIVAVTMSLPRSLPWATVIRQRMPPPAGALLQQGVERPVSSGERRPRTP